MHVGLNTDPWGGLPCAAQGHEEVEDSPTVPKNGLKPLHSSIYNVHVFMLQCHRHTHELNTIHAYTE